MRILLILAFLVGSEAFATRKIYFAQGVIGVCVTYVGAAAQLYYPSQGWGGDFVFFNPSAYDQTVKLNATVEFQRYAPAGNGPRIATNSCTNITLTVPKNGGSAVYACGVPAGQGNAQGGAILSLSGSIEVWDTSGAGTTDQGFITASGNVWACLAHTTQLPSGAMGPTNDGQNHPFEIAGGKPF